MQAAFMESVSRKTYWISVACLIIALIVPSAMLGLYDVGGDAPTDAETPVVRQSDPLTAFLLTPLGRLVMLLLAQYILANILFWLGVWVRYWWLVRQ